MEEQVKKTGNPGAAEYHRLKKQAKDLGIDTEGMKKDEIAAAIDPNGTNLSEDSETSTAEHDTAPVSELERLRGEAVKLGLDVDGMDKDEVVKAIQRKQISDTERIRIEEREKIMQEQRMKQERAEIVVESESLGIPVELPEVCTELDLAKARRDLGLKKKIPKPSPETLAIEASKKGYYIFRNLEQDDVDVSCCPGGKYHFDFIPDKVHVLPDWLVRKFLPQRAIFPIYGRVPRGDGKGEDTVRTGTKPRFTFEFIDEAPQEAKFGIVLDEALLAKLLHKELV